MFGGQSGAIGHLKLGHRVIVGAKTAVFADLEDGSFVTGVPAMDHRAWKRSQVVFRELPELRSRIRRLEQRLAELDSKSGEES